jgi:hypothetical protein
LWSFSTIDHGRTFSEHRSIISQSK